MNEPVPDYPEVDQELIAFLVDHVECSSSRNRPHWPAYWGPQFRSTAVGHNSAGHMRGVVSDDRVRVAN